MKAHNRFTTRLIATCVAALMAAATGSATAQAFPSKPIKVVLPFPAGSGSDLQLRPMAEFMSRTLAQPVLIDNKPGGSTTVAALYVKSQAPDGYTILTASNTVSVRSLISGGQFDIRKDFTPISPTFAQPLLILVNADQVKATTVKDLLAETKARPDQINYGSYGVGSGAHMFMEILLNETKTRMVHVPYQGTAQAAADTAAGRVQVTATILASARPYLSEFGGSGKLRAIGVTLAERSPLVPNLPGMKESGFANIDFGLWGGIVGPSGIPRNVVDTLNRAVNGALKDPTFVDINRKMGSDVTGGTPEDLARTINREYESYEKLIRETGLKLE